MPSATPLEWTFESASALSSACSESMAGTTDSHSFVMAEAIEKQCNELDRLIRDFSSYLENAVGMKRFLNRSTTTIPTSFSPRTNSSILVIRPIIQILVRQSLL